MSDVLTLASFPLFPYRVPSDGVHINRRPSYFVTEEGNGPQRIHTDALVTSNCMQTVRVGGADRSPEQTPLSAFRSRVPLYIPSESIKGLFKDQGVGLVKVRGRCGRIKDGSESYVWILVHVPTRRPPGLSATSDSYPPPPSLCSLVWVPSKWPRLYFVHIPGPAQDRHNPPGSPFE